MQVVRSVVLVVVGSALVRPVAPEPLPTTVRDTIDLWGLARPRSWQVFEESSFDRTGGNDDGFSGRYGPASEREGGRVIFDRDGPGAITRIWSANPSPDCMLSFTFDGEEKPRVSCSFAELFKGDVPGFPKPFVDDSHGGFVSYVPIPFAKHLRVVATGPLFFWQITAATDATATDVRSFDPTRLATDVLSKHIKDASAALAAELFERCEPAPPPERVVPLPCTKAFATADGRPIPTFAPVEFPARLAMDQAVALELEGPAVVTSLVLHVEGEGSRHLRTTLVRIFVDDDEEPSVESPLGDLFALVDVHDSVVALPFTAVPPRYELRFVQPFAKKLRIHVINADANASIQVDASVSGVAGSIAEFGDRRFFARWQRTTTKRGEPLQLVGPLGAGHIVGVSYIAKSAGGIEYLEGDETVAIDGRSADEYHGTGTEDFFDSGWYWRNGPFSAPLFGLTHKNESAGEIAAYRIFTSTAIAFDMGVIFTLEHGGGNDAPNVDVCTVTCGYAARGTRLFLGRIDTKQLVPMRTMIRLPRGAIAFEDMDPPPRGAYIARVESVDPAYGGPDYALVGESRTSRRFDIAIADRYRVSLLYSAYAHSGRIRVWGPGLEPVEIDTHSADGTFVPLRTQELGVARVDAGKQRVRAQGIDGGRGMLLGLVLEPSRDFVRAFDVAGPFPLEDGAAFERALGPEDGSGDGWTRCEANANGYLDLRAAPHDLGEHAVAFARFMLTSPTERTITLRLGSDDSPAVFVNGVEAFRSRIHHGAAPDQDFVPLKLTAGKNTIVVKIANDDGSFGLYARISDPDEGLEVGAN